MSPTAGHSSPPPSLAALLGYVAAWLVAGAGAAALIIALIHEDDEPRLPPVRQIELGAAVRAAGCELRSGGGRASDRPAVAGPPAARPARPAVYRRAPAESALVGAMRRGVVVVHYRPGLPAPRIAELEQLHEAMPVGTIVAPNAAMPFAIAVTAWRQRLSCRSMRPELLDAVQLFRGRYVGSGPDG